MLWLTLFAAAVGLQEPQWIAPSRGGGAGPEPRWVWAGAPGQAAPTTRGAPAGSAWFSASFEAPADAADATLFIAADNAASAYLNGDKVLECRDWASPVSARLVLRPGGNVLSIEARNDDAPAGSVNPAGLIARLQIDTRPGHREWLVTDGSWRASVARWEGFPGPAPDGTPAAVDLGPAATPPWNLRPGSFERAAPCPILRRSFTLDDAPTRARVRVIGLGHFELRCNGSIVGDSIANQAWSQYDKTLYWQEFDLTPHLREGENVLAVMLGNSFWSVAPANDPRRYTKTDCMPDFSKGRPYLLWLDAQVTTPSGTRRITSDDAWRWTDGPLTFSNIFAGEDYDARLEPPGWDRPGGPADTWQPVAVVEAPAGRPTALDGPAIHAFVAFEPAEVRSIEPGVHTYVFPQNCSALLRFTLEGGPDRGCASSPASTWSPRAASSSPTPGARARTSGSTTPSRAPAPSRT
jgi:alpha-L-rhamnosidase